MYAVKAAVFNYLTKNQKSSLCSYLRNFVRRYEGLSVGDILDEFIEDETELYEADMPNLHFAVENFNNEEFLRDLKTFIKAVVKDLEHKEAQRPYVEAQKEAQKIYAREQRKHAQEYKMGLEKPTQKQIKYYMGLCKSKNVEPQELEGATKLDLKNWIGELVGDVEGN